jgi:dihydroceramide fatty acyl 2-hydroxylase
MSRAYSSIRVFKNPILERTTHVHPLTPLMMWLPVAAWLFYRSLAVHQLSLSAVLVVGIAALVSWTLMEYVLHRYVFHFEARTPTQQRLQFLIHGLHHDDPVDPTRLVMPPAASLILAILIYSGLRALLGPVWVDPFFSFFLVGYLCYDYIHFGVHHFTPRTRLGKYLKQSHMLHHYVTPNARWGVSSPLWDYVFSTLNESAGSARLKAAAKSKAKSKAQQQKKPQTAV